MSRKAAAPVEPQTIPWRRSEPRSECYDEVVTDIQFFVALAVAPAMSLVIVLAGYIVQNSNLNARTSELRNEMDVRMNEMNVRMNELREDMKDLLRAELGAIRAEMARNNAELLATIREEMARNNKEILDRLSGFDRRIHELEVRR